MNQFQSLLFFPKSRAKCVQLLLGLTLFLAPKLVFSQVPKASLCIDHYPPSQVVLRQGEGTGENVEVVKQWVKKLNYQLTFITDVPFSRCLDWLEKGKVDLMVGLLGSDEREQFAHLFLYDNTQSKGFVVNKTGPKIEKFEDLYGLRIGIITGEKQFKKFEESDTSLFHKMQLRELETAFQMLLKNRLDTVLATISRTSRLMNADPHIQQKLTFASYTDFDENQTYIGLSKRSPLAAHWRLMQEMAHKMYINGEFEKVITKFREEHPEYY